MIHIQNNLPKDCNQIFDGLENHLMMTVPSALMMKVVQNNLNQQDAKIKNKES